GARWVLAARLVAARSRHEQRDQGRQRGGARDESARGRAGERAAGAPQEPTETFSGHQSSARATASASRLSRNAGAKATPTSAAAIRSSSAETGRSRNTRKLPRESVSAWRSFSSSRRPSTKAMTSGAGSNDSLYST